MLIPFLRVTFESPRDNAPVDDALQVNGSVESNWTVRGARACGVEELSASESSNGDQVTSLVTCKLVSIGDTLTNQADTTWRMKYRIGGRERVMQITGVRSVGSVPRKLEIMGTEWRS